MAKKDRRTPALHTHAQYGTLFIWEQTAQGVDEVETEFHISTSVFFFINHQVETLWSFAYITYSLEGDTGQRSSWDMVKHH